MTSGEEGLTTYLIDTSAWHRRSNPAIAVRWAELLNADEYDDMSEELDGLHQVSCGSVDMQRALQMQRLLAHTGRSITAASASPTLLIAATAERAGLVVLHYDEDYDRVAAVTGQPTEWVVPKGSVS